MLPKQRKYKKQEPSKEANLFIIICEGEKREPQYFEFFDRITSKIKVVAVPSTDGKSAPNHLIENAKIANEKFDISDIDELWYVFDKDRWGSDQIENVIKSCDNNHFVAISNPCFEVWLYYHFSNIKPKKDSLDICRTWKNLVPKICAGGFNSEIHSIKIHDAINNAKANYSEFENNIPDVGSTQIYRLAEKFLPLIKSLFEPILPI